MHINPDHYLDTPAGRVITAERNSWAWQQCYAALPLALAKARSVGVVAGVQGLRNGFAALEPPSKPEGSESVLIIEDSAA